MGNNHYIAMDIKVMFPDVVDWSEMSQYLDSAVEFCAGPQGFTTMESLVSKIFS